MKLIKSTLESMSKGEITSEELQNVISIIKNLRINAVKISLNTHTLTKKSKKKRKK